MLPILLLLAAPDDIAAKARELTRAEPPCRIDRDSADITVCGRREADRRFRVTFVETNLRDVVPRERSALLEEKLTDCGRIGMVPRGCGFAGVAMTSGGGKTTIKPRKLAP
ncbi:hypothetical protein [Sphingomonas sp. RS2018]